MIANQFSMEVLSQGGAILMSQKSLGRKEVARFIRAYRKDRAKFRVVRNENAFCAEMVGTGMVAIFMEVK
jgi:hypothetical protein